MFIDNTRSKITLGPQEDEEDQEGQEDEGTSATHPQGRETP